MEWGICGDALAGVSASEAEYCLLDMENLQARFESFLGDSRKDWEKIKQQIRG
jgi:hypothetical protein